MLHRGCCSDKKRDTSADTVTDGSGQICPSVPGLLPAFCFHILPHILQLWCVSALQQLGLLLDSSLVHSLPILGNGFVLLLRATVVNHSLTELSLVTSSVSNAPRCLYRHICDKCGRPRVEVVWIDSSAEAIFQVKNALCIHVPEGSQPVEKC